MTDTAKPYAQPVQIRSAPTKRTDEEKGKHKADLKKFYNEEKKMVRGKFLCFEPLGGSVSFAYRKYEWEQPTIYNLTDGEEYEIPLGVARHLNGIDVTAKSINGNTNTCSYPIHAYQTDSTGKSSVNVGKRIRRYAFQTLDGTSLG